MQVDQDIDTTVISKLMEFKSKQSIQWPELY